MTIEKGAIGRVIRLVLLLGAGWATALSAQSGSDVGPVMNELWRIRILIANNASEALQDAQAVLAGLPDTADPVARIAALNVLSDAERVMALTEPADRHAREALALARAHDDAVGQAEAWLNIAENAINQADLEAVKQAPEKALAALQGVQGRPDLMGKAMMLSAMVYIRFGKLEEAMAVAVEGMEAARRSDDPFMLTYAHHALAVAFDQTHRKQEALEHFTRMRESAQRIPSRRLEASALTGMAAMRGALGDAKATEATLRQAIALHREIGGPFYLSHGLFQLAENLHQQGRQTEALATMGQVLDIQAKYHNRIGMWWVYFTRSNYNQTLLDLDAAMLDAEQAHSLARDIGLARYVIQSLQRMARIAAAQGDYRRAFDLLAQSEAVAQEEEQVSTSKRVIELVQRYREESSRRQIEALERISEQQNAQLHEQNLQRRWLIVVLVLSIVALAVTMYLQRRLRHSHGLLSQTNLSLEQSRDELTRQRGILQSILDSMGDGVVVANASSELLLINPVARRMLNLSDELPEGRMAPDQFGLYLDDKVTRYPARELPLARAIRGESCDDVEIYARNDAIPEGRWLSVNARPLQDRSGGAHGAVAVFSDISARKRAQAQVELSAQVFEQSAEGILIFDTERRILSANRAYCVVSGYAPHELLGRRLSDLSDGALDSDLHRQLWSGIWRQVDGRGQWQGEVQNRRRRGELYPAFISVSAVLDTHGKVSNYIYICRDISQHKEAEQHIRQLAYFDALTELPNRSLFNDRIAQAISHAQREQQPLGVLFLDLDRFKNINDSLGHHVGDEVLVETARRLERIKRAEDTVSRLGGDEFILLLPGADSDGAAHVAGKIIDVLAESFLVGAHELSVTPSIGISMYPADGDGAAVLIKNADSAMYRAKQDGRNTFRFFTPEMYVRANRVLQLENALRHALERDQLALHYQPQIDLRSGQIIGCEALMRWHSPEFGMVSPAEFIPIAEDSGQILAIGEWALQTAIGQAKVWEQAGLPPLTMAVNLSVVQFRQRNLAETVQRILEQNALASSSLELELTERVAMDDPVTAVDIINCLHRQGVKLSIDDFGTGYSSLAYLKQLNLHRLKIDRSFVRDIADDPDDREIVRTIIALARGLGLRTIAEGVETCEQRDILAQEGCDECQGYYFGKPMPPEAFIGLFGSDPEKAGGVVAA